LKLIHTADWHLGRALYGRKRYDEQGAFLELEHDLNDDWRISSKLDYKRTGAGQSYAALAGDVFPLGAGTTVLADRRWVVGGVVGGVGE